MEADKSIRNISDFEKDLGRHLKDLMSNKDTTLTHSLLEQLLSEIKHMKAISYLGVNKLSAIFSETLQQQKVIAEKINEQNMLAMDGILPELQKFTRLLDGLLSGGGERQGKLKRDQHESSTDGTSGEAVNNSTQQLIEDLRRYDPLLCRGDVRLDIAQYFRNP